MWQNETISWRVTETVKPVTIPKIISISNATQFIKTTIILTNQTLIIKETMWTIKIKTKPVKDIKEITFTSKWCIKQWHIKRETKTIIID